MSELHVVIGAGALGYEVMEKLLAAGRRVRAASRSGRADVPDGVAVERGDISNGEDAVRLCDGATTVYFCAAPPYTEWPQHYPGMYEGVMVGAAAAGARIASCENVYPYGRVDGPMTEDTPLNPCSKKGELRAELGEKLLAAHRDGRVKAALCRGPDYFGPRAGVTTVYGDQVFGRALDGKAANVFGDIDARHTFIFGRDFARGLVAVGSTDDAMGRTWHMPCPPALTQRAMLELIFERLERPMKAQAMPGFVMSVLALFSPLWRELNEMSYQWKMDYDFRCDAIVDRFGLEPTPHREAIAETLAWFEEQRSR